VLLSIPIFCLRVNKFRATSRKSGKVVSFLLQTSVFVNIYFILQQFNSANVLDIVEPLYSTCSYRNSLFVPDILERACLESGSSVFQKFLKAVYLVFFSSKQKLIYFVFLVSSKLLLDRSSRRW
jgi:hypothetical protein